MPLQKPQYMLGYKQAVSLPTVWHWQRGSTPQWNGFQEQRLYIFQRTQFFQWAGIAKKGHTLILAITPVLTEARLHVKSITKAKALEEMLEKWDTTSVQSCVSNCLLPPQANQSTVPWLLTSLPFPQGFFTSYKHMSVCSRLVIFHCNKMI